MKKLYVLASSVLVFSAVLIFAPDAKSNQSGAASNYSGVNSSLGTCARSGCHSGGINTGPGSISITGDIPVLGYVGGQTYQVTVTVTSGGSNGNAFGFAVSSAKTGTSTISGTFNNTDNSAQPRSGGQYATHTLAGTNNGGNTASKSYVLSWTAPAAGTGPITIYAAGNSANGNGNTSGDNIYRTSLDITEDVTTVSLDESMVAFVSVFPNPASGQVVIDHTLASDWNLKVVSLSGKVMHAQQVTGGKYILDVTSYPAGMYLLQIEAAGKTSVKKIVVQ